MELLVPFVLHNFSRCDGSIMILDGLRIKNIFKINYVVYQGLQFGENMAHPFLILKVMFMAGYYNELTVKQRQIIC